MNETGVHSIRVEAKEGRIGVESSMEPRELLVLLAKAGKRIHLLAEPIPPQPQPSPPPPLLPPSSPSSSSSSTNSTDTTRHSHARARATPHSSSAPQRCVSSFDPADIDKLISTNRHMRHMTITDQRVIHMTFNDPHPHPPSSSTVVVSEDVNIPSKPKPEPEPEPGHPPVSEDVNIPHKPDHPPAAPAEETPSSPPLKANTCCVM